MKWGGGGGAACTRGPTVSVVIDLVVYRADTPKAQLFEIRIRGFVMP